MLLDNDKLSDRSPLIVKKKAVAKNKNSDWVTPLRLITAIAATSTLITFDELNVVPKPANLRWAIGMTVAATMLSGFAGWHYYRGGVDNLWQLIRCRMPSLGMDTLVSLSSLAILIYSPLCLFQVIPNERSEYRALFITLAALNGSYLLKERLSAYINKRTRDVLPELKSMLPTHAQRYNSETQQYEQINSAAIKAGDKLKVFVGERFPVDATLTEARLVQDGSLYSGEFLSQQRASGAHVKAGTINSGAAIVIIADCNYSESYLVNFIQESSKERGSKFQRKINHRVTRVIAWFVPFIILASWLTFWVWYAFADNITAIQHAINVLLGSCPCTFGLANAMPWSIGKWAGVRNGVLLQRNNVIDMIDRVRMVVFDKTGTLTQLAVDNFQRFDNPDITMSEAELLQLIVAIQQIRLSKQPHDLYANIINDYIKLELSNNNSSFQQFAGLTIIDDKSSNGITVKYAGNTVKMGSAAYVSESNTDMTSVWLTINNTPCGVFTFKQQLIPEAAAVMRELHNRKIELLILTGDESATGTQQLVQELNLGFDLKYFTGLSPNEKKAQIEQLQETHVVAYIGDGFNDAGALEQADVGICVSSNSPCSSKADITIDNLYQLLALPSFCSRIRMNHGIGIGFALLYNLSMMLSSAVILLDPMIPGSAMAASSLCVLLWAGTLIPTVNHIWNNNTKQRQGFFSSNSQLPVGTSCSSGVSSTAINMEFIS